VSVVTGCLLLFGLTDEPDDDAEVAAGVLASVNAFFAPGERGFVHIEAPGEWYGGTKALQSNVAVGAFNYLDRPALLAHLRERVDWHGAAWAQLCYQGEWDDRWTLEPVFGL
jgi:hypothetical protein